VRADVIPIPDIFSPSVPIDRAAFRPPGTAHPGGDGSHLPVGQVDLQGSNRHPAVLDGMEIGTFTGIGGGTGGTDPEDGFAAWFSP
jgi:hypothetical protein